MSALVSRLLDSLSGKQKDDGASHVLSLRPSSNNPDLIFVHPAGYPEDAPPLYSIVITSNGKPNMLMSQGGPDPRYTLGDACFPSISSKTRLSLRGQPIELKMSQMSGDFSLECPAMGKLRWKINKLTGSSLELYDTYGTRLATLKSAKYPGNPEKELKILVPCDTFFVELVVLSGMAAKLATKANNKAAAEVAEAFAGV